MDSIIDLDYSTLLCVWSKHGGRWLEMVQKTGKNCDFDPFMSVTRQHLKYVVSDYQASHWQCMVTLSTLPIGLQLNPDFDRGFPRSESLVSIRNRLNFR